MSYSTVTRELRKPLLGTSKDPDAAPVGRPPDQPFYDAVAKLLREDPTRSAREIARILQRDHSSVLWVLKNVLGLQFKKPAGCRTISNQKTWSAESRILPLFWQH